MRFIVLALVLYLVSAQDAMLAVPTGNLQQTNANPVGQSFDSRPPVQQEQLRPPTSPPSEILNTPTQAIQQNPPVPTNPVVLRPPVPTNPVVLRPPVPSAPVVLTPPVPTKPAVVPNPIPKPPVIVRPPVPVRQPTGPVVWLCDRTGARRGSAGSPEAERVIASGVTLTDCPDQRTRTPPPVRTSTMIMCDTTGRRRGASSSPYVRSLVRQGVQLQPCTGSVSLPPVRPAVSQMCDTNGRRRGLASSPYVMSLVRQGVQLTPCTGATVTAPQFRAPAIPPPSRTSTLSMCDTTGRRRGSASSPYVMSLVRQGVQLQPCAGSVPPARTTPPTRVSLPPPRIGGATQMCDTNGRRRGLSSSPYVMSLVRQGMSLTPCSGATVTAPQFRAPPPRVAQPPRVTLPPPPPAPTGSTQMCDTSGRRRGRASSPYVQSLVRQGMRLNPCPGGRATDPGSEAALSSTSSSSTSATPAWAVVLIVVGILLAVVLIVLIVRLTQVLKN